jgi:NAD(P)-dependent dehydrogenase (short-subunit alcohol dehydrogenase family)
MSRAGSSLWDLPLPRPELDQRRAGPLAEAEHLGLLPQNLRAETWSSSQVSRGWSTGVSSRKRGSIVNIASVAGHRAGYSSSVIYGVAKAAVLHLTRCAAMELGEDGVRVNSISPGGIATGIFAKALGRPAAEADATAERIKPALAKLQAIPRAGLPEDIANAAVYLASDEAGFINGEDIVVDGGLIWDRRSSEVMAGGSAWKHLFE